MYGTTNEDDGRGYAASVLPFQAYGALGMDEMMSMMMSMMMLMLMMVVMMMVVVMMMTMLAFVISCLTTLTKFSQEN